MNPNDPHAKDRPATGFWAPDVFDSDSEYNIRRASFQSPLKLRGLFYEIQARKEKEAVVGNVQRIAAAPPALVILAADPDRVLNANVNVEIFNVPFRDERRFRIRLELPDQADQRAPGTACQAFVMTRGLVARLCGQDAVEKPAVFRTALHDVFRGVRPGPSGNPSRVLAAIPEIEGRFDDPRFADFPEIKLPGSTQDVVHDDIMAVVVVIDDQPLEDE